ncbi:cyclic nucleotide-binding protein [Mycolicibacterium rutilum]|uniref:Cyclic nucleotide-binding protein n=1 Tax=Mycolicibacterium rutilum TaxID=370526 RepID=A0A1H6KLB9_MYCRU|nr:putative nucleotidyltransferase substrate binding domain-containing protein [Mycolicibacterium rutilum]SEH76254.1 cyclic nucleotide-binding protein [Mycolicibacterium rutilum]
MPSSSELRELTDFLTQHTPFQAVPDDELAQLASGAQSETYPAGALVADYSTRVPDDVWMVRSGQVVLRSSADGTVIDTVDVGGIFGYLPLLTGAGSDFDARTAVSSTLIRLPGALVRAQFAKPAGLAFLASSGWTPAARPTITTAIDNRPVSELLHGDPLLVAPDASVRDVVIAMTERHVGCALIRLPGGEFGIFTDRDLRTKVVAAGLPLDTGIDRVMSAPARTVTADLTADTVLMEMLECGLRHMPVVTTRGEVVGVVEDADLLAASARQSFLLRRAIGSAASTTELETAGARVTAVAADLFRNGTKATATSAILSVVIDSLVRKALELAIAESGQVPLTFAWLTLGSVARREAMPSSDVDSALSFAPAGASDPLRDIAARVHRTLDGCGLPSDSNGAVAYRPAFARAAPDWASAAEGWLKHPLVDRGLIMSSLLIDGRVVWGDPALHTVPAVYRRLRTEGRDALRLQLLNALSGKVRTRGLRDVLSRRGGTFDLKNHAVTPIVNLARWGGLTAGVSSATTPARLAAAAQAGSISERDADTLCDVFAMLQRLRMAHQVEQISSGRSPGDVVTMSELSPLNRSLLGEGLREIAAVRRRVGGFGVPRG